MTEEEREALEAEFLEAAEARRERMFDLDDQPVPRTLRQREHRAVEAGDPSSRLLLQSHIQGDELAEAVVFHAGSQCGRPTAVRESERPPPSAPARSAAGRLYPLDLERRPGAEGCSPAGPAKIECAGGNAPSFEQAAAVLELLAGVDIPGRQVQRVTERLGTERRQERDREVVAFRRRELRPRHEDPPRVVAVRVDAGKVQMREDDGARGVRKPRWADTRVACLHSCPPLPWSSHRPPTVTTVKVLAGGVSSTSPPFRGGEESLEPGGEGWSRRASPVDAPSGRRPRRFRMSRGRAEGRPSVLSPSIEWHRPASVAEACNLLAGLEGAVPLAGGTDVVVDLRRGALGARHLVSLGDLGELRGIDLRGGDLRIGALATPAEMERSDAVRDHRPELLDAVSVFGGPQVRNRATVGGNLCTATSCGDMAPLLLALGARVVLAGPADGRREVPLAEFFTGPRTTVRTAAEILVEVLVPARTAGEGARYETFGLREAHYITVAGAAAALRLEGGTCVRARLVLGAVGPTPLPVPEADRALEGTGLGDGEIAAAAALAMEAALPVGDVRGSADHRRSLVEVLAARALRGARDRAKGGGL